MIARNHISSLRKQKERPRTSKPEAERHRTSNIYERPRRLVDCNDILAPVLPNSLPDSSPRLKRTFHHLP